MDLQAAAFQISVDRMDLRLAWYTMGLLRIASRRHDLRQGTKAGMLVSPPSPDKLKVRKRRHFDLSRWVRRGTAEMFDQTLPSHIFCFKNIDSLCSGCFFQPINVPSHNM